LEEENRKLRRIVADLSPNTQTLQDVLPKIPEACSAPAPARLPAGSLRRE
jgi:hypothetical protein